MVPSDLLYTNQHEWIQVEGDTGTVGITDHAQEALGDITFVEAPSVGTNMKRGAEACAIESCKAAASVYAPVSGLVTGINGDLDGEPGLINSDPYGRGWIYKITIADQGELSSLMDAAQYETFLAEQDPH